MGIREGYIAVGSGATQTAQPITVSLPIESAGTQEPEPNVTAPSTLQTNTENVQTAEPTVSVSALGTISLGVESVGTQEPAPSVNAPSDVSVPVESWSAQEPTIGVSGNALVSAPIEVVTVEEPEPTVKLIIIADTVSLLSSRSITLTLESERDIVEELESAGEQKQ